MRFTMLTVLTAIAAAIQGPRDVNFVRPGLQLKIAGATIQADGTIQARVRISDPKGLPLDRDGIVTPGAVSISFVAAYIPAGQSQYVSYATRLQTSPITHQSATQASADTGGTFEKLADGEYRYTFGTKAPSSIDRNATHSIGVYSSRNLTEFGFTTNFANDIFTFVPAGGEPKVVRDVVRTETCNNCHDPLNAHGGARQSVQLCVMCHTPQTTDPDTGNSVDLTVMVHKIHMGKNLPSVKAGKPYQIIGFNQTVADYSTVGFPTDPGNCVACHKPGAAQSDNWLKPTRAACGSCHDNVNFATGENHVDLPQISDSQCSTCHTPEGELEFDASIKGAHTNPRFSRDLPGTVFELMRVDDAAPGKRLTATFKVTDKSGKPIVMTDLARLALVLAGPTSDYATMVSEDVRATAKGGGDGVYTYTFTATLPETAAGTYTAGIEGYRNVVLLAGTKKQVTVRDAGANKQINFSVDGSKMAPRRQIVSLDKCNACHVSLSLHGDNRNRIEQCVMCHNPNGTDVGNRPAAQGPPQAIDFRTMIHKIHTGENLEREYTVYGFGGSKNDYSDVRFPGDRRVCSTCHVNGSEQLPLKGDRLDVTDPRGWLPTAGPVTAACTSCHGSKDTASHALVNTSLLGESCAACHGEGLEFAVSKAHAR